METNLIEERLVVNQESILCLDKMRKWTMFFAIFGFIFLALFIVFGFFIGIMLSTAYGVSFPLPDYFGGIVHSVIALVYFFPALFLYRFSISTKESVLELDTEKLNVAFKNLKAHFQYIGILTIVVLGAYVLIGVMWFLYFLF